MSAAHMAVTSEFGAGSRGCRFRSCRRTTSYVRIWCGLTRLPFSYRFHVGATILSAPNMAAASLFGAGSRGCRFRSCRPTTSYTGIRRELTRLPFSYRFHVGATIMSAAHMAVTSQFGAGSRGCRFCSWRRTTSYIQIRCGFTRLPFSYRFHVGATIMSAPNMAVTS